MSLVLRDTFAPSKRPYAIRLDRITVSASGRIQAPALWAGRRKGRTTISLGYLWGYGIPTSPARFIDAIDMRYGGHCEARWDGDTLWTDSEVTEDLRESLVWRAGTALEALPDVPDGYTGWFYAQREAS